MASDLVSKLKSLRAETGSGGASTISVDIDSTAFKVQVLKAKVALEKLDKDAEQVARKAKAAQAQVARARSLADRLRSRGVDVSAEGFKFKGFQIGGGGFGIDNGAIPNISGKIMMAAAITRAVGSVLNIAVNARDVYKKSGTYSSLITGAAVGSASAVADSFDSVFGFNRIGAGVKALASGTTVDEELAKNPARWEELKRFLAGTVGTKTEGQRQESTAAAQRTMARAEAEKVATAKYEKEMGGFATAVPGNFQLRTSAEVRIYQRELMESNAKLAAANRDFSIANATRGTEGN